MEVENNGGQGSQEIINTDVVNMEDANAFGVPEGMQEEYKQQGTNNDFQQQQNNPNGEVKEVVKPNVEAPKGPEGNVNNNPTYNPYWEQMKSKLGEGFEIPEAVKTGKYAEGQTEFDLLVNAIWENTEGPDATAELHPLAKEIDAASKQEGFDLDTYLEHKVRVKELQKVPAEDLIRNFYKQTHGSKPSTDPDHWTEEEIEDYVKNLSPGMKKKEASDIRQYVEQFEQRQLQAKQEATVNQNRQAYDKYLQERSLQFDTLNKEIQTLFGNKEKGSIFGVEIDKQTVDQVTEAFKSATLIDQKTGKAPIHDLLSNNMALFKLFLLENKQDHFKSLIGNKVEQAKNNILNKVDINPRQQSGQANVEDENDLSAFGLPERQ